MNEQLLITICGGLVVMAFAEALLLVKSERKNTDLQAEVARLNKVISDNEKSHNETLNAIRNNHGNNADRKDQKIEELEKRIHFKSKILPDYIPMSERIKPSGEGDVIFKA